jgi:hypothetical protein
VEWNSVVPSRGVVFSFFFNLVFIKQKKVLFPFHFFPPFHSHSQGVEEVVKKHGASLAFLDISLITKLTNTVIACIARECRALVELICGKQGLTDIKPLTV